MPRIRSIKPELTTDRKFASISRPARYTFVMLIAQADDDGLVFGTTRQLLGTLYPHDESLGFASLSRDFRELVGIGAIRWRETVDGAAVVEICNWAKHQRIDHKSKSLILPLLRPASREPRETLAKDSRDTRVPSTTLDHGPRTIDQGSIGANDIDILARFEGIWEAYPKRAGGDSRKEALDKFSTRIREGVSADEIEAGVNRYRAFCVATGKIGTEYVKQARTFFGPSRHWEEPWTLPTLTPTSRPGDPSPSQVVEESIRIFHEKLSNNERIHVA